MPAGSVFEIFDGQQRLTVTMALIAVIKHECEAHLNHYDNDPEARRRLEKLIVAADRMLYVERNGRRYLRLKMNLQNRPTFQACIRNGVPRDGARSNVFLQTHVFHHLRVKIQERLSQEVTDSVTQLEGMLRTVKEHFHFVVVLAAREFSTATLFETMNFRGTSLEPEDLLKSLLYATASEQGCQSEVEATWDRNIVRRFESGRPKIQHFLKAFWIARHHSALTGNLYTSFRRDIAETGTSGESISEYVQSIADHVEYFLRVAEPVRHWPTDEIEIRNALEGIRLFGGTFFQPLLMVLVKFMDQLPSLSISERTRVFRAIEASAIRDHVCVGTMNRSQLAPLLNSAIERLDSGGTSGVDYLIAVLQQHLPSDSDFREAFAEWSCDVSRMARHILWRLELHKTPRGSEPISDNPRSVTLEHIMPQTLPQRNWSYARRYHRRFVNRIGNFTLLGSRLNNTNDSFRMKRERSYAESRIILTRELLRFERWRKTEIVDRQKELATLAAEIWRIDD